MEDRFPITLVQFPSSLGVVNASPFCAKLELWLRLADIPYRLEEEFMPGNAPKKKIPYVLIDGKPMGDSTLIIEHLTEARNVTLDDGLTAEERARDTALWAMLDERLYWYIVYDRWLGSGWPQLQDAFFGRMVPGVRQVIAALAHRAVRKQLWQQGTGRHKPAEVQAWAERDLAAIATLVGDGPYVHGDTIRSIDAVVYGTLISLIDVTLDTPMNRAARAHENLCAYTARITEKYFPEFLENAEDDT